MIAIRNGRKPSGGTYGDADYSVQQTTDGGYIIAGVTYSDGVGDKDVYLIKTDTSGTTQWEKTLGGEDYDPHIDKIRTESDKTQVRAYHLVRSG